MDDFIIDKTISNIRINNNGLKIINKFKLSKESLLLNNVIACSGFGNYMLNICPTLTCGTVYYLTKYKRYLTPDECLLLQGFSKDFKQVVSNTQIYKQIGNSMSVNVLKVIFDKIFNCTILNYTI